MKKIIFLNLLYLLALSITAQNIIKEDIDALNQLAHQNMRNPPEMKQKVDSAILLAKKIGYKVGLGNAYKYKGIYYYFTSEFDSSAYHHHLSLNIFQDLQDSLNIGKAYLNIATTYSAAAVYDSTTIHAVVALQYFEELNDNPGIGRAVNLLGIVNFHQKDFEEALKYFTQYLKNAQATSDSSEIASGYNNIASVLIETKQYDSAIYYFEEAIRLKEKLGNLNNLGQSYESLGSLYSKRGNSKLALRNYQKAYRLYKNVGERRFMSECEYNIGVEFKKIGMLDSAEKHLIAAITISDEIGALQILHDSKSSYANLLFLKGNGLQAYETLHKAKNLSDSILNLEKIETIADIETKYETEKKEQQIALQAAEIAKQTAENERKVLMIIALIAILILLITVFFLFRNRAKRKQQLIIKEKDLKVKEAQIEATLSSQESERKRFAEDLHDGFGQLISALRLNMNNFNQEAEDEQKIKAFEHSEKILDDMHSEIRAIAFNLMPVTLIQEGILSAVKEFSRRINTSGQLKIEVSSFELNGRFPEVFEVALYRIIQEWVNNVIKYAEASKITIQLDQYETEIVLIIEDNGKGFDKNTLLNSQGNGWRNIQTRANLTKSQIEIDSNPSRTGTSFILNAPTGAFSIVEKSATTANVL
jgi:signal transduction histidine kinase